MFEFIRIADSGGPDASSGGGGARPSDARAALGVIIEILPHMLIESELREVYDRDKTKNKGRAKQELHYIAAVANFGSPYFHWTEEKQQRELGRRIFGKPFRPDRKVQKAINAMYALQEESYPAFRYYRATQNALDKLTEFITTFDPSTLTSEGRPLYTKELAAYVEKAASMAEQLSELRKKISEQKFSKPKTSGNRTINHFEK